MLHSQTVQKWGKIPSAKYNLYENTNLTQARVLFRDYLQIGSNLLAPSALRQSSLGLWRWERFHCQGKFQTFIFRFKKPFPNAGARQPGLQVPELSLQQRGDGEGGQAVHGRQRDQSGGECLLMYLPGCLLETGYLCFLFFRWEAQPARRCGCSPWRRRTQAARASLPTSLSR